MNCIKNYNCFCFLSKKVNTFSTLAILLFFVQIIVFSSCSGKAEKAKNPSTEVIIDLSKVAGNSMAVVNNILGKPESVEEFFSPTGESLNQIEAIYNNNKFEIVFYHDKANSIIINNTPDLTNDNNALEKLGLKNQKPTSITPETNTSWENIEGIALINCFKEHIFIRVPNKLISE